MRGDDRSVSKYRSISGFIMRDRSANGSEFLLAEAEKGRRELQTRVEEHLLLHLDYSPQKARMGTVVI